MDTGVISRYFLKKPQLVNAYDELTVEAVPVISASVYIELMQWLNAIRGRAIDPITKLSLMRSGSSWITTCSSIMAVASNWR